MEAKKATSSSPSSASTPESFLLATLPMLNLEKKIAFQPIPHRDLPQRHLLDLLKEPRHSRKHTWKQKKPLGADLSYCTQPKPIGQNENNKNLAGEFEVLGSERNEREHGRDECISRVSRDEEGE